MFIKKLACIAAVSASAIAPLAYAGSAYGIELKYSVGTVRILGETDKGSFSENVNNKDFITIDFNDVKDKNFKGNELVNYTFNSYKVIDSKKDIEANNISNISLTDYSLSAGNTGIFTDSWAPGGTLVKDSQGKDKAAKNISKYLAVFQNKFVSIKTNDSSVFNYFGLNAGALSSGNTFELLKGGVTVEKWNFQELNSIATSQGIDMADQKNGFFEFFSEGVNDNFDEIRLYQQGGGGFETDNHTFHIGTGKFKNPQSTPEPGAILGMLAVGGMVLHQRRKQKLQNAQ